MKLNIIKPIVLIIIGILAFFVGGCIEDAENIKLPAPKIVVSSFISPQDSIIEVRLRKARPFFNDTNSLEYEIIENASVFLSDGEIKVPLEFTKEIQAILNGFINVSSYRTLAKNIPIIGGKTYFLEVNTADGLKISASSRVPLNKPKLYSGYISQYIIRKDTLYQFMSWWTDPPGISNYYYFRTITSISIEGNLIKRVSEINWEDSNTIRDDIQNDGKEIKTYNSVRLSYDSFKKYNSLAYPKGFQLLNIDENFYNYYKNKDIFYSKNNFPGSQVKLDTSGTPTLFDLPYSEPVYHFTNINGGLGIFASYQMDMVPFKINY